MLSSNAKIHFLFRFPLSLFSETRNKTGAGRLALVALYPVPPLLSQHSLEFLGMTDKEKTNGKKPAKRPVLDQNIQAHIGRKLRAVYDEVAAAPIPDRLIELLAKLEENQRK
jgi:Anti-sigma factor NepR